MSLCWFTTAQAAKWHTLTSQTVGVELWLQPLFCAMIWNQLLRLQTAHLRNTDDTQWMWWCSMNVHTASTQQMVAVEHCDLKYFCYRIFRLFLIINYQVKQHPHANRKNLPENTYMCVWISLFPGNMGCGRVKFRACTSKYLLPSIRSCACWCVP